MFKFGDPEWYESYVQPYKEILWPPYESTHQPPRTHTDVKAELARMKAERISKKTGKSINQITQDEINNEVGGVGLNISSSSSSSSFSSSQSINQIPPKSTSTSFNWPNNNSQQQEGNERLV
ncbi:uncharacterized protein I206_106460 [Kwoniella pini CBS 10737]|uniref:Uncharacterized protein n=1 Tax=Kwoniella pini CBS 10737 TaxID=1296096 RepID=A0A1B9HUC7_9TREE|nr:uncharacterized protein I206_07264 [Kwoniella pini CBS 10737]OCF46877.1 hypothetical protein I206_07264 [Kwoniella pini CBS 10737]